MDHLVFFSVITFLCFFVPYNNPQDWSHPTLATVINPTLVTVTAIITTSIIIRDQNNNKSPIGFSDHYDNSSISVCGIYYYPPPHAHTHFWSVAVLLTSLFLHWFPVVELFKLPIGGKWQYYLTSSHWWALLVFCKPPCYGFSDQWPKIELPSIGGHIHDHIHPCYFLYPRLGQNCSVGHRSLCLTIQFLFQWWLLEQREHFSTQHTAAALLPIRRQTQPSTQQTAHRRMVSCMLGTRLVWCAICIRYMLSNFLSPPFKLRLLRGKLNTIGCFIIIASESWWDIWSSK